MAMYRLLPATLHPDAPLLVPAFPTKASSSTPPTSDIQPVLPYQEDSGTLAPTFEAADLARLDLLWPVETRTISSAWGPRMRSRTVRVVKKNVKKRVRVRFQGTHKGVDLTAPAGTDVYAAMDGIVVTSSKHRQYGNYVVIDHGNGVTTLYAHHKRNFTREGDLVRRGQKIAEVGRSGNATGSHLHFELRLDGVHQNPLPYLNDSEEIPAELVAQNQAALPLTRRR
jgi:murein DD-endopeptidase MepM/ murein hydrolase activator NlpD